jgi:hypothetical protein
MHRNISPMYVDENGELKPAYDPPYDLSRSPPYSPPVSPPLVELSVDNETSVHEIGSPGSSHIPRVAPRLP